MYLDKAETFSSGVAVAEAFETVTRSLPSYETWADWPPATVAHHGKRCCEFARSWLSAMDFSLLAGASKMTGPRWLNARYAWGPSVYPVTWCEAVKRRTLDCGVLAAFAQEVLTARGVRSSRVQLVQRFSEEATRQWKVSWAMKDADVRWVENDLIYHEACTVSETGESVRIWDASAGWWIDPEQGNGYGSVLALRIVTPRDAEVKWGRRTLATNHWHELA